MQHPDNPEMTKEQLSQLMDGEWHELNPSECVKGMCSDDALRSKWARYHLIRDAINNEPMMVDNALASRICAAIEDEPAYSNISSIANHTNTAKHGAQVDKSTESPAIKIEQFDKESRRKPSWVGTGMTGFALAASVAAVTVVGLNMWGSQSPEQAPTQVQSLASNEAGTIDGSNAFSQQVEGAPLPQVELVANTATETGGYWVSPQSSERVADEERLNMFMSQHIENSPTADRGGLFSYSRLVGYDERAQER